MPSFCSPLTTRGGMASSGSRPAAPLPTARPRAAASRRSCSAAMTLLAEPWRHTKNTLAAMGPSSFLFGPREGARHGRSVTFDFVCITCYFSSAAGRPHRPGAGGQTEEEDAMKWITRERARVDRIACPWLISRFIDREATFLFVPADQVLSVAQREGATPYDVPNVELGHHGDHCSFDAFIDKYRLTDPALQTLARIVRGADTDARQLTPESAGLYALATGFQAIAKDDHDNMARQFHAYDALYAYCRATVARSRHG